MYFCKMRSVIHCVGIEMTKITNPMTYDYSEPLTKLNILNRVLKDALSDNDFDGAKVTLADISHQKYLIDVWVEAQRHEN